MCNFMTGRCFRTGTGQEKLVWVDAATGAVWVTWPAEKPMGRAEVVVTNTMLCGLEVRALCMNHGFDADQLTDFFREVL